MHDREQLVARWRAGERPEFLMFWGHRASGGGRASASCFSQWWALSPFIIDGVTYPTAEHWMMAGKARLFGDQEILQKILAEPSANGVKSLGRKVRGFEAGRWDAAKRGIVLEGNLAKFGQHENLRKYLLSTRDQVLVEASPFDAVWGIGLGRDDPRASDPLEWQGENLLGFVLMDVREKLLARG